MRNENLLLLGEDLFDKNNPGGKLWGYSYIYFGQFIPDEKLKSAKQSFAKYNENIEIPILLLDDTLFGSSASGFLITNLNFYYKLSLKFSGSTAMNIIPLSNIQSFSIQVKLIGANLFINGKQFGYTTSLQAMYRKEAIITEEFMNIIINNLNQNYNEVIPDSSDNSINYSSINKPLEEDTIIKKLKDLKGLLDEGILSEDEFIKKKTELIKQL